MSRAKPEVIKHLKSGIPLFAGFTEELLAKLVNGSRVVSFEPNEAVVECGSEATHFGVILGGTVTASVIGDGGTRQTLGRFEAGGTFGEMALMTGDTMLADLIAESRCEVLLIPVVAVPVRHRGRAAAVQHISRTIAERFKTVMADPRRPPRRCARAMIPTASSSRASGRRRSSSSTAARRRSSTRFYDTADESRHARGLVERIGIDGTRHVHRGPKGEVKRELPKGGFAEALQAMVEALRGGPESQRRRASRRARRRERFTEATLITDEVLAQIEALSPLAPLHNPVNVAGIREMRRLLPAVPHVAVFDTAFHHTLPAYAYLYGLPYELLREEGRAPLRLPRHVAPVRQPARGAVSEAAAERAAKS